MEQLIYTSCKTGINAQGAGFQIYSYSPGITQETALNAQRYICQYKEPFSLPGNPTNEQIESMFPSAFKYLALDSDRSCLCLSTYIGRDYMGESGRFGNFISHVLCVNNNDIDFYTVDFYNSPLFMKRLPYGAENSDDIPDMLDCISAADAEKSVDAMNMSFDLARDFLCSIDNGTEYLKAIIAAIIDARKTGRRILICDLPENVPLWIAAAIYSFPKSIAKKIFFTTYAYNPEDCDALICGVFAEGTAYEPKNAQSSGLYYIFDFLNGVFPEFNSDNGFFELVQAGFEFSKESMELFHDFLTYIDIDLPDERIYLAYDLYAMLEGESSLLSEQGVMRGISALNQLAVSGAAGKICEKIYETAQTFSDILSFESASEICGALLSNISEDDTDSYRKACAVFFKILPAFAKKGDACGNSTGELFYLDTVKRISEKEQSLLDFFFSERLPFEDLDGMLLIKIFTRFLSFAELTVRQFAQSYSEDILKYIFDYICGLSEEDFDLLAEEIFNYDGVNPVCAMELLKAALNDEELLSKAVRRFLHSFDSGDLSDCGELLNIRKKYACAFEFIKKESIYPQVVFCFIDEIERDISLCIAPWEQWDFIEPIYNYKCDFSIPSSVDKTELLHFAVMLKSLCERKATDKVDRFLKECGKLQFDQLSPDETEQYLSFVLPVAMRELRESGQNLSITDVFSNADRNAFCRVALKTAADCFAAGKDIQLLAVVREYASACMKCDMHETRDGLLDIISTAGTRRLERINAAAFKILDVNSTHEWLELSKACRQAKKGIISKLSKMFSKNTDDV